MENGCFAREVVEVALDKAVGDAYELISWRYGFAGEYPVESVIDAFDCGFGKTAADALLELFGCYGLDADMPAGE